MDYQCLVPGEDTLYGLLRLVLCDLFDDGNWAGGSPSHALLVAQSFTEAAAMRQICSSNLITNQ